jgi:hypothetical protein
MPVPHARRLAALLLTGLVLPAPAVAAEPAAAPAVRVVGLRVSEEVKLGERAEHAISGMTATGVSLLVEVKDASLVQILPDQCAVKKFADDKGTDLLAAKPKFGGFVGTFPKYSPDRKSCLVEVQSDALPARGAKTLTLEGTLAFSAAQGVETVKAGSVKLAKGTTFKAGDLAFTVEATGKPQWGDDPLEVTLQIAAAVDPVSKIRFLDASGQEIPAMRTGSMSMRGFGAGTISWTYAFKKASDAAVVEVTLWKGLREMGVPVKLEFGVGM